MITMENIFKEVDRGTDGSNKTSFIYLPKMKINTIPFEGSWTAA